MGENGNRSKGRLAVMLVVVALAAEVLVKYYSATVLQFLGGQTAAQMQKSYWSWVVRWFRDESTAIWLYPIISMKALPINTVNTFECLARWLPWLVCLILPARYAAKGGRGRILLPALFNLLVGAGVLCVALGERSGLCTWVHSIPFFLEGVFLLFASAALKQEQGGLSRALELLALLLAVLSPFVSAALTALTPGALATGGAYMTNMMKTAVQKFPQNYAACLWPLFKAFAFLLYALILHRPPEEKEVKERCP